MLPRKVIAWSFAVAIPVLMVGFLYFLFRDLIYHDFPNLRAISGIKSPILQIALIVTVAAIPATFIIFLLESTRGSLEFSVLGIKLKGPSGPILLWVVVFLAVSAIIIILLRMDENKILWK